MKLTWKQLAEQIAKLSLEQQNTDVTVLCKEQDEFFPMTRFEINDSFDVLDDKHPYLVIDA